MHNYGAGTNVGNVRDNNEDSYVCDEEKELWIVADGMGGLGFGEVASAITTYTVAKMVREGHGINQAIEVAHRNIKDYAESDGLGTNMGTTIVLLLSHGSLYNIFWVGDSRAYLFDANGMKQVTVDHSLVQSLIEQGEITKEEAYTDPRKNAVTRALGVQELETVRADSISERWQPNQKILLCSDGLTDCVRDHQIEEIMMSGGSDQEIVDNLIEAALEGGGNDNITVIVVSAPTTVKSGDSDTHVPGGNDSGSRYSDDTFIPSTDNTQSRSNNQSSSGEQLSLNLDVRSTSMAIGSTSGDTIVRMRDRVPPATAPAEVNDSSVPSGPATAVHRSDIRNHWQKLVAGCGALLCLVLVFTTGFDAPPAPAISENFRATEIPPAAPRARHMPEFSALDFDSKGQDSKGQVLQVGLFSQLAGAERMQHDLVALGLMPHVEKRLDGASARYAVMVGPLTEDAHQEAIAALDARAMPYFRRPESG